MPPLPLPDPGRAAQRCRLINHEETSDAKPPYLCGARSRAPSGLSGAGGDRLPEMGARPRRRAGRGAAATSRPVVLRDGSAVLIRRTWRPVRRKPGRARVRDHAGACGMTRIAVYGAGGVGGYFGARLARAGADVHFLARGAHLRALREHGLRVRSVTGDFQVPARPPMIELTSADATSCCSASRPSIPTLPRPGWDR